MTKCDFCTKSNKNGKCFWSTSARESDCRRAIELMIKALQGSKSETKRGKPFR